MSSARDDDLRSWTRRQWGAMVAALVLGQAALILTFAEREPVSAAPPLGDPGLKAVGWPVAVSDAARQLGVSDPLLFALPGARGFSGEAWRLASDPLPPRVEWAEPVRWLAGESEWFGGSRPGPASALLSPRRPLDRPTPALTALSVRPLPIAQDTRLELDERLRGRGLSVAPELPAINHTNLLDATILRVAIEPDGTVFSAIVIKASGWEAADRQALDLVRRLRFTSQTDSLEPSNDRQWGRVQVRWRNAALPAPPPDRPNPSPGA